MSTQRLPSPRQEESRSRRLAPVVAAYSLLWVLPAASAARGLDQEHLRAAAGVALAMTIVTAAVSAFNAPAAGKRRLFWCLAGASFLPLGGGTLMMALGQIISGPWTQLGVLGFIGSYPVILTSLAVRAVQEQSLARGWPRCSTSGSSCSP